MKNDQTQRTNARSEAGQFSGNNARGNQTESQNSNASQTSGSGQGWHGDSEGHARAGSQSHKNDGKR